MRARVRSLGAVPLFHGSLPCTLRKIRKVIEGRQFWEVFGEPVQFVTSCRPSYTKNDIRINVQHKWIGKRVHLWRDI